MIFILTALSVLFSLYVVYSNNIIYSLLCLVMVFFLSGLLMLALRVEFLGYVVIIVYVGALAILFLFVVMTLDITSEEQASVEIKNNMVEPLPCIAGLAYFSVVSHLTIRVFSIESSLFERFSPIIPIQDQVIFANSLNPFVAYLYGTHFLYMILAGLLLLVAMVGAVLLTLEKARANQNTQKQQYQHAKKQL